ncbi:DUF4389 domain-containing protein [Maritimibacter dapengensis]|uniref:DUF4389 domain-containing protein n=1 Tax=Maritimibacter dapengensis TaxID=2836868 RepID=A0ABS6SZC5_9RHOB|nr:DUF4389 domain-containing protein [Maritimibacter dapengensis]MBV7378322.1 DUF4389 domain-containing protein [Maritimibacter dapengensis]
MAKKDDEDPVVLEEPGDGIEGDEDENIWLRGLWMILFIALMWVARGILIVAAVIQFLWMLFGGGKNPHIAEFGEDLGDWMARATIYVSGATEDRPFPFDRWGIPD